MLLQQNAVKCCNFNGGICVTVKRGKKPVKKQRSTRASVSLSAQVYQTLQALARQKRVSVAWVMRDAMDKYVADQWPLFSNDSKES